MSKQGNTPLPVAIPEPGAPSETGSAEPAPPPVALVDAAAVALTLPEAALMEAELPPLGASPPLPDDLTPPEPPHAPDDILQADEPPPPVERPRVVTPPPFPPEALAALAGSAAAALPAVPSEARPKATTLAGFPAVATASDAAAAEAEIAGAVPVAPSAPAPERERRGTPVSIDLVAQALATASPLVTGAHEPEEITVESTSDESLEILDAQAAVPVVVPPIPAEASGRIAPPRLPSAAAAAPSGGAAAGAPARARMRTPPPLPPAIGSPEALASRPRRKKRSKPWFEEVFDEDYLRTLPFMTAEQTVREATFVEEALAAPKGGEVLDVACGYGRHAIELVQRGLKVTGLDLSLPLLIRAADESQRRGLNVNFVHADMREMAFEGQFDAAYCMLTSFGYFDEETNGKVADGVARALKPGGRFLIDVVNRDYIVGDLPTRVWWEGDGCVVLEEVDFNFHTSRILIHRSIVFEDGRQLEQELSIRAYSLHELGRLLRKAGFRVIEVSGGLATRGRYFGATSRNLLILCEKAPPESPPG